MRTNLKFLAVVAVGGALALAGCGGSPADSPVAATSAMAATSDDGAVAASGYGPGPGSGAGYGLGPGDGTCDAACTGPVGPDPADIDAILAGALQEEYHAESLYRSVLEDFPGAMPFAVIAESEAQHVAALLGLFERREKAPPSSATGAADFPPFASLAAACAAGVAAEAADAAFYTPYLKREDLPQDVRMVFTNLQRASLENHLPAFERCR
jgi:hypothetical protein